MTNKDREEGKKNQICKTCNGDGEVKYKEPISNKVSFVTCKSCEGKGYYPKY